MGYNEGEGVVVLRTQDVSGVPPIVALLSPSDAKQVAEFLTRASSNASPWGKEQMQRSQNQEQRKKAAHQIAESEPTRCN